MFLTPLLILVSFKLPLIGILNLISFNYIIPVIAGLTSVLIYITKCNLLGKDISLPYLMFIFTSVICIAICTNLHSVISFHYNLLESISILCVNIPLALGVFDSISEKIIIYAQDRASSSQAGPSNYGESSNPFGGGADGMSTATEGEIKNKRDELVHQKRLLAKAKEKREVINVAHAESQDADDAKLEKRLLKSLIKADENIGDTKQYIRDLEE